MWSLEKCYKWSYLQSRNKTQMQGTDMWMYVRVRVNRLVVSDSLPSYGL